MTNAFADLTPAARKTFVACFLGWSLDAFDFFLLTFVVTRIATDFHKAIPDVAFAITLTLMCRPLGAVIFGWIADRFGRRTPLMIDVALFSLFELATAFSPNFTVFLVLRALYGVAMGGEWGLGAAMAMEALPPARRGFFSGLLQEGYMVGYLLAALAYFAVFSIAPHLGWRALFVIGTLPALLILYIRANVPESPAFLAAQTARAAGAPSSAPSSVLAAFKAHWPLFLYAVLFMSSLNFLSHGTQDLYATSLQKQRGFDTGLTTTLSVIAAFGAIAGGILFGALSQRFGRRACIMIAALCGTCAIPLWAFSPSVTLLAAGAFTMQFMVQGAWGVIPAHLNELSPPGSRGTFPGFVYQIGNLISAGAAQMEAAFATRHFPLPGAGADYAKAMAIIAALCFAAVFVFALAGYAIKAENRDSSFIEPAPE